MPRWTDDLTEETTSHAIRLHRCRPKSTVSGIVTSRQMERCPVHYWRGRTTPCEATNCDACQNNRAARWYGWLGLWNPNSHEHVIVELTAACFEPLNTYILTHGQVRGAKLTLGRTNQKINSRLCARIEPSTYSLDVIPAELDVRAILEHIWETHHTSPHRPRLASMEAQPNQPLDKRRQA